MALDLNVSAPKFSLVDIFDRKISLEDYLGKKVMIGFFRHAGCPFCNIRVHSLLKVHEELKAKNLEMIFFFESTKSVMLQSSFHREVSPIPIISDSSKTWYNAYGLEESTAKSTTSHLTSFLQTAIKSKQLGVPMHLMASGESFSTMPAEFLLDEKLIIRKLHYSRSLTDRMNVKEIIEFAGK
ncbi:MAG: redoxin domain-containing protein [Cytophagales bacterium]|nr:redoxin domain-containing protein [Cytophagales bacterium]